MKNTFDQSQRCTKVKILFSKNSVQMKIFKKQQQQQGEKVY